MQEDVNFTGSIAKEKCAVYHEGNGYDKESDGDNNDCDGNGQDFLLATGFCCCFVLFFSCGELVLRFVHSYDQLPAKDHVPRDDTQTGKDRVLEHVNLDQGNRITLLIGRRTKLTSLRHTVLGCNKPDTIWDWSKLHTAVITSMLTTLL